MITQYQPVSKFMNKDTFNKLTLTIFILGMCYMTTTFIWFLTLEDKSAIETQENFVTHILVSILISCVGAVKRNY